MMNIDRNHNRSSTDELDFVSLISTTQRRILAYIITLVPNRNDAEEIMQETTILMWEKRSEFIPGTDFVAWGARIAYYKILNYRKRAMKNHLVIDEMQFTSIEEQAIEKCRQSEEVLYKLDECINKITESDRRLVWMRYSQNISVKEIAFRINKSVRSVYLAISRIHGLLLRCIEGTDI
jgi:RNA polymerase sigma-70 factor (ECF subfamily)